METPGMPFNQAFSLPIELKLKRTPLGDRLTANPIRELKTLRGAATTRANVELKDGLSQSVPVDTQLLDIVATIEPGQAKTVAVKLGLTELTYDATRHTLDGMPLPLEGGTFTLRVVVDRPLLEVIGGGGSVYKTVPRKDGGKAFPAVELTARGGTASVKSLAIHSLRSIWEP
jgi:sucrose-6-phosphate hydrolase SacC (GH32 family)